LKDEKIISRSDLNVVFPKVSDMIQIHRDLAKALEMAIENDEGIGHVILPYVNIF
jgi:hypothetical protein